MGLSSSKKNVPIVQRVSPVASDGSYRVPWLPLYSLVNDEVIVLSLSGNQSVLL